MECCSLWIGMRVLPQVTKLDSAPAPGDKNMPPGDAFVWAVHYLTVTCLSAGRDRGDTAQCPTRPEWFHSWLLLLITVITPEPLVRWLILWCNDSAKWLNYISPAWNRCSHLRLFCFFAHRFCLLRQCATVGLPRRRRRAHMLRRQSSRNPGQCNEEGQ